MNKLNANSPSGVMTNQGSNKTTMTQLYTQLFRFAIVVSIWLTSSCAAATYPQAIKAVDPGTAVRGMQSALNGAPGTFVLQKGKDLIMGWPSGSSYSWIAFSANGRIADTLKNTCGNRACPEVAGDLYNWLEQNGWNLVPSGAIPAAVANTIRQFAYILAIGESLPFIPVIIMPGVISPAQFYTPTQQS